MEQVWGVVGEVLESFPFLGGLKFLVGSALLIGQLALAHFITLPYLESTCRLV